MQRVELFIYEEFSLVGMVDSFYSLKWVRRFRGIGEFCLEIDAGEDSKALFEMFKVGSVIYKKDVDESMLIQDVSIENDGGAGGGRLTVSGRSFCDILDWRVLTLNASGSFKALVQKILNENYVSPANVNRKIGNVRFFCEVEDFNVGGGLFESVTVYDIMEKLAREFNLGFRVCYNVRDRSYDLEVYGGRDKGCFFSSTFNNVLGQEYYYKTSKERNVCYLELDKRIYLSGDEVTGFSRREFFAEGSLAGNVSGVEQARRKVLGKVALEGMASEVNAFSKQFEYKKDWDLGDIVTISNKKWGVSLRKNVMEIVEFFDEKSLNISIVLGDSLPDIGNIVSEK